MSQNDIEEPVIEPDLPIVDPHHHLWDRRGVVARTGGALTGAVTLPSLYMGDELAADLTAGHNVRSTVFVEAHSMRRAGGPEALRPIGETEFVNGMAAVFASDLYGPIRACAGIVGYADFTMGDAVAQVLEAHVRAAPDRFRGLRQMGAWDDDASLLAAGSAQRELYRSGTFRRGFARLAPLNLSFDAWVLEPQIGDVTDLARAFPQTPIVLDHVGTPLGIGAYKGRRDERFGAWRDSVRELAKSENAFVKLGGLAMPFPGFASFGATPPASSEVLAAEWKPYLETCVEAFGPDRCMFESNFPVDRGGATYRTLWNAFKRFAAGYSPSEKAALFSGTAERFYRLQA
jgi:predicted TIM-barrel fold metal-dependent hydrolase